MMADVLAQKLNKFLIDYFEMFYLDSSGGIDFSFPEFDFYAYDYLEFAEEELDKNTDASLINCISNLKRAMDCQLDTFLHVFNLHYAINKRNLKFETKLEFLKECGVFNSRSLVRLNTVRNKMEHEYKRPKIEDIEVYYDLVVSFISVLERTMLLLHAHGEMYFAFNATEIIS